VDTEFLKREIAKLKDQEDRYNRAYGGGAFTVEQLKEYTIPVRERVVLLESQISKSEQEKRELQSTPLPDENEIAAFAREASEAIYGLDFKAQKTIVSNVIERVTGTRDKLQVYGFIPVTTETNVNVFTSYRHRQDTHRHDFDEHSNKLIPFHLEVNLPSNTVHNKWN
jgi:site-specific DNA recombinase